MYIFQLFVLRLFRYAKMVLLSYKLCRHGFSTIVTHAEISVQLEVRTHIMLITQEQVLLLRPHERYYCDGCIALAVCSLLYIDITRCSLYELLHASHFSARETAIDRWSIS